MRLCHWLQNKALIDRALGSEEELDLALLLADCSFTCLHTGQPWGPDQDHCAPESCQPGRGCFEPSPRDPGVLSSSSSYRS